MQPASEAPPMFVDLNLLPDDRRARGGAFLLALAAAVAIGCAGLLPLFGVADNAGDRVSRLQTDLAARYDELQAAQVDLEARRALRQELSDVRAEIDAIAAARDEALPGGPGLPATVQAVVGSLPAGVEVTSVNGSAEGLALGGTATSSDAVFSYARALEATGDVSKATVISMVESEGGAVAFSLTVTR